MFDPLLQVICTPQNRPDVTRTSNSGFRGFEGLTMAFLSQAFSSETLIRGLDLAGSVGLELQSDASPEEMLAELQRLEDSQVVWAIIF